MISAPSLRFALFGAGLAALAAAPVSAAVIFADNFTSPDGTALSSTSGWSSSTSPTPTPTVNGGALSIASAATTQNLYRDFGSTVSSGSIYVGFDFTVTDAPNGNANLGFLSSNTNSPGSANSSFIFNIAAGSAVDTFKFGTALANNSGPSGTASVQSASSYAINTTYRVVIEYNFIDGALNNTANLYVDGSVVASAVYGASPTEVAGFAYFGLRQPGTSTSTAVKFDDLVVATSFSEAATFPSTVPEPASYAALVGAAALGLVAARRRRAACA